MNIYIHLDTQNDISTSWNAGKFHYYLILIHRLVLIIGFHRSSTDLKNRPQQLPKWNIVLGTVKLGYTELCNKKCHTVELNNLNMWHQWYSKCSLSHEWFLDGITWWQVIRDSATVNRQYLLNYHWNQAFIILDCNSSSAAQSDTYAPILMWPKLWGWE